MSEFPWPVLVNVATLAVAIVALIISSRARALLEAGRVDQDALKKISEQWKLAFAAGEEHSRQADESRHLEARVARLEDIIYKEKGG